MKAMQVAPKLRYMSIVLRDVIYCMTVILALLQMSDDKTFGDCA